MFGKKAAIGIEIASNRARLAVIQKKGDKYQVKKIRSVAYNSARPEVGIKALQQSVKRYLGAFGIDNQVLSVREGDVIFKRLPLVDADTEDESHAQICLKLADSLGVPLEELLFDYQIRKDQGAVEAFACRKSALEKKINALTRTGFSLSVLDLKPYALMRLYQYQSEKDSPLALPMLIDVGYSKTQLCFYQPHLHLFHREIAFSTASAINSDGTVKDEILTHSLANEIQRQYQLAGSQLAVDSVGEIWLSGPVGHLVNCDLLSSLLNKQVDVFNPFAGFEIKDSVLSSEEESMGAFATPLGLAMRGLADAS
ncbi:type IV pilus biogenesis protein PilM [Veronia pacifica]|uniref:Pilus assembly protein PilM n=1 Tax=Veronia pacifica TaxID=1080227 RepID=A0A1C3EGH2_9GAMM|nr:pilus assembly protein PilM [Veronia pacifica]ODA32366.1 hypothetical protein A8L45_12910 [Veronia pacifica]